MKCNTGLKWIDPYLVKFFRGAVGGGGRGAGGEKIANYSKISG